MDNVSQLINLVDVYSKLMNLDRRAIFKENLGDESLKGELETDYNIFISKLELLIKYGKIVPRKFLIEIQDVVKRVLAKFEAISNQNNQDFITNRQAHSNDIYV